MGLGIQPGQALLMGYKPDLAEALFHTNRTTASGSVTPAVSKYAGEGSMKIEILDNLLNVVKTCETSSSAATTLTCSQTIVGYNELYIRIMCSPASLIYKIDLTGDRLAGIPNNLSDFTGLEEFNASTFSDVGVAYETFGLDKFQNLPKLKRLQLSSSSGRLIDTLPTWIATEWPLLEYLYLNSNSLTGDIVTELFDCPNLYYLRLQGGAVGNNNPIPNRFNEGHLWTHIIITGNQSGDMIPSSVLTANDLIYYQVQSTNANVQAFPAINWPSLQRFYATQLAFNGTLPAASMALMPDLIEWDMRYQQITGNVPIGLANALNFTNFEDRDGQLTGYDQGAFATQIDKRMYIRFDNGQMSTAGLDDLLNDIDTANGLSTLNLNDRIYFSGNANGRSSASDTAVTNILNAGGTVQE